MKKKLLLLILDGFGNSKVKKGNAIKFAKTTNIDEFRQQNPESELKASGRSVGLLNGDMGNSEVGHLNIGAGRIVHQLNTLILKQIKDGSFFQNKNLLSAIDHVKKNESKLHLFGLLSDGNVHSNIDHLWAILKLCKQQKLAQVYFHVFMDGRDTLPHSGKSFIEKFQKKAAKIGIGKIATISGRYYVMDRDTRWDRIALSYQAIVHGKGEEITDPVNAIQTSYDKDITDEFVIPKVIIENGKPVSKLEDDDAVIAFNFRADRMRQITNSLVNPKFKEFDTHTFKNLKYVSFNEYDVKFKPFVDIAFKLVRPKNILGEVISSNNLNQLRLAETEKYAHVTFFFNGGSEEPLENEDRILVKSPPVATYDLQPEMSALEVKDKLLSALDENKYELIVTNFANCDMVGHTGDFDATVKAVESVDNCVGEIIPKAKDNNYNIVLIADHGNAEKMLDEDENIFTAHTTNKVPCVISLIDNNYSKIKNGILADVAPTILEILDIKKPKEMTGKSLLKK